MASIDHIVFASPVLADGIDHIEQLTGVRAGFGGPHPGVGTHNALMTLGADVYFEIIAIDPDQADFSGRLPFGLSPDGTPRLAGYAIHPDPGETIEELAAAAAATGFDPGPVQAMSRRKPDGEEISWKLTYAPDPAPGDRTVPFIIDWESTPSPALSSTQGCILDDFSVTHPDSGAVRAALDALGLGIVVDEGPVGLRAVLDTPNGSVELTS